MVMISLLSRPKKVSYISNIYVAVELFAARATNPRVQPDRNFALKTEFRYLNGFWKERESRYCFQIKMLFMLHYCPPLILN